MYKLTLMTLIFVLVGCSGKLYTIVKPDIDSKTNQKINGVLFYRSMNVIELYKTTVLVDKESGNRLGAAPESCKADHKLKFSTRTDYASPNIIVYEPGLLETNKFGVTLDKGALTGVNVESTPTSLSTQISELIPYFKAPKAGTQAESSYTTPFCNAGTKLIGVYKAPDIKSFDEYQNDTN